MDIQKAFIELIREHEALIHKVAKVYSNSREDEEDLYQEIVYQVWKSFSSFRNDSKVSTWIYRVALNTSITYLGKQKKKGRHLPIDERLLNEPAQEEKLKEERVAALYAQIRKLSTIEKALILLYLEEKTYEEMAAITGFSISNVGTRLARIRQKLASQIN